MSEILVPVSFGELLDKIAILQIKSERISDPAKLANIRKELSALEKTWMSHPAAGGDIVELRARLKAVNERLWVIEDDIRVKEKAQQFDAGFVELARSVYFQNDQRARIKKDINTALGSAYVEEKSYEDYGDGKPASASHGPLTRAPRERSDLWRSRRSDAPGAASAPASVSGSPGSWPPAWP